MKRIPFPALLSCVTSIVGSAIREPSLISAISTEANIDFKGIPASTKAKVIALQQHDNSCSSKFQSEVSAYVQILLRLSNAPLCGWRYEGAVVTKFAPET
jgi:hypothetical protein